MVFNTVKFIIMMIIAAIIIGAQCLWVFGVLEVEASNERFKISSKVRVYHQQRPHIHKC